jgi:hypothetical protein
MSGVYVQSGRVDGGCRFTVKWKVDHSLLYRLISKFSDNLSSLGVFIPFCHNARMALCVLR